MHVDVHVQLVQPAHDQSKLTMTSNMTNHIKTVIFSSARLQLWCILLANQEI